MNIKIMGTGSALPALRVTNDDLSKIMETSDEWIASRTGIRARHLAVEETTTSLTVDAATQALKEANVTAEDIDIIIAATISPDKIFPGLACEVQSAIGAKNAVAFDVSAACAGFIFSLHTAAMYLQTGMYKHALVIGAEVLSKMMDWNDRSTCVLFGDGAGAAVVGVDTSENSQSDILGMVQYSDGAKGEVLNCDNRYVNHPYKKNATDLSYTYMNGQEVYKFAVRTVPESIMQAVEKAGWTIDEVDHFILHQANYRIIEAVAKRLKQNIEKFPTNIAETGNISAATVPILLDKVNKEGMIKRGDKIILAGFGAGLTWGATALIW